MNAIKEIINNHTYVVNRRMLDFFQSEYDKGTYSKWENIHALALEWSLRDVGILKTLDKVEGESYQWRHDWAYSEDPLILIDLKRRPFKFKNISISKFQDKIDSYQMGQLTHFVSFTTNLENISERNIGDVLTFNFDTMIGVKEAWTQSFAPTVPSYRLLKVA